jgi:predicted anti-sigma-YlaC factor YlaD
MKCSQVRKKLSAFLDGQGTESDRTGIRRHLESCSECRQYADELQGVSDDFELIGYLDVQPYFLTRLKQRIADQESSRRMDWRLPIWVRRAALPVGAAAAIVLSAVIGDSLARVVYGWRAAPQTMATTTAVGHAGSVLLGESLEGPVSGVYDQLISGGTGE